MLPFLLHRLDNAHNIQTIPVLLFTDMISSYDCSQVLSYFYKHYKQAGRQTGRQTDACIRLGESGTDDKKHVDTKLLDLQYLLKHCVRNTCEMIDALDRITGYFTLTNNVVSYCKTHSLQCSPSTS